MNTLAKQTTRRDSAGAAQAGLTLVELMIAITLGMLLIAGVARIFIGQRQTFAFNEGIAWIQENGRFAAAQIESDLRMAGYMGCLSNPRMFNNLGGTANPFRDDLATGIQGFEFTGTAPGDPTFQLTASDPAPLANPAAWSPNLPNELGNPARVIRGSDVVVVRYVSPLSNELVTPFSSSSELVIAPPHNLSVGEILVATDCQKASIFQLTGATAASGVINLAHASGGGFSPGNATASWGTAQSYGLSSEVAQYQVVAYYVGQGASGVPSLFALRLDAVSATSSTFQAFEIAEGVDTMQLRYGVDTDADQQINSWLSADAVTNWGNVLATEISLVLRSDEEYGTDQDAATYNASGVQIDPFTDRRLRQVVTTRVSIRNRLP